MIDPKSIDRLEVHQNRKLIGHLTRTKSGSEFTYTADALSNAHPAALHLPKTTTPVTAQGTVNLPAFFANLLPEGVVQDAIVRANRLSRDDLFSQLALTATDAVGDITVHIPGHPMTATNTTVKQAIQSLKDLQENLSKEPITGLPGVQPKISIGPKVASSKGTIAIVKIPPPQFPGILENELAIMRLARKAGLKTPKVKLQSGCLVVTRFDRVQQSDAPPVQIHVEDALQILNLYSLAKYSLDYLEILNAAVEIGMSKAVLIDLLRLYVFSYAVGNGDLHAKNVSFLRTPRNGLWTMTPAYDLVCTLPYEQDHRMALALDEQWSDFQPEEILSIGRQFDLPESLITKMLMDISSAVFNAIAKNEIPVNAEHLELLRTRTQNLAP